MSNDREAKDHRLELIGHWKSCLMDTSWETTLLESEINSLVSRLNYCQARARLLAARKTLADLRLHALGVRNRPLGAAGPAERPDPLGGGYA